MNQRETYSVETRSIFGCRSASQVITCTFISNRLVEVQGPNIKMNTHFS